MLALIMRGGSMARSNSRSRRLPAGSLRKYPRPPAMLPALAKRIIPFVCWTGSWALSPVGVKARGLLFASGPPEKRKPRSKATGARGYPDHFDLRFLAFAQRAFAALRARGAALLGRWLLRSGLPAFAAGFAGSTRRSPGRKAVRVQFPPPAPIKSRGLSGRPTSRRDSDDHV